MKQNKMLGLYILSIMIALFAIVTSVGGILFENVYRDNKLIITVMKANDIVTLFIVVPLMVACIFFDIKKSYRARLIWIGMSMSYLFTGNIPQTVIDSGHPTAVVFATDLSMLPLWVLLTLGCGVSMVNLVKNLKNN